MTYFYWDASALVKRYAPEIGTPIVHLFSRLTPNRMMCLAISMGEIFSIFVRKRNDGTIPQDVFSQVLLNFRSEVLDSTDFQIISVEDVLILESHPYIEKHNLNATDALILRSALDVAKELRADNDRLVLITADHRMLRSGEIEGLQILNPETISMEDLLQFVEEVE